MTSLHYHVISSDIMIVFAIENSETNETTTGVADVGTHCGWEKTSQLLIESHGPTLF